MTNNKKEIKKFKLLTILSFIIFICTISFRLFVCNDFAIKNTELSDHFIKREELEKEISSLKYTDSQLASLIIVEEKAKELGFVEMESLLIALDPTAPARVAALTQ